MSALRDAYEQTTAALYDLAGLTTALHDLFGNLKLDANDPNTVHGVQALLNVIRTEATRADLVHQEEWQHIVAAEARA